MLRLGTNCSKLNKSIEFYHTNQELCDILTNRLTFKLDIETIPLMRDCPEHNLPINSIKSRIENYYIFKNKRDRFQFKKYFDEIYIPNNVIFSMIKFIDNNSVMATKCATGLWEAILREHGVNIICTSNRTNVSKTWIDIDYFNEIYDIMGKKEHNCLYINQEICNLKRFTGNKIILVNTGKSQINGWDVIKKYCINNIYGEQKYILFLEKCA